MSRCLTNEQCQAIAEELEGEAKAWWETYRPLVQKLGREQLEDLATAMEYGRRWKAATLLIGSMSRREWEEYVATTTKQLQEAAQKRADVRRALAELGMRVMGAIGRALTNRLWQ